MTSTVGTSLQLNIRLFHSFFAVDKLLSVFLNSFNTTLFPPCWTYIIPYILLSLDSLPDSPQKRSLFSAIMYKQTI